MVLRQYYLVASVLFLCCICSLAAGSPLTWPDGAQYEINPIIAGDFVQPDVSGVGTGPSLSVKSYRWYWDYSARFPIVFQWAAGSGDIADGSDVTAVQSALDTWENVAGCSITNSLVANDGDWGSGNGDNEIGWVESGWNSFWGYGLMDSYIAVAITWYAGTTQLETDIIFNGEDFTWFTPTDDSGGETEHVEHIALHELGHAFSLKDLYDSVDMPRTMYGYSGSRNMDVSLDSGDEAAIAYAYPEAVDNVVPEPTALMSLCAGLALLGGYRFRGRK